MNTALAHRGPDDGSVDAYGPCVLGHRRLRVVDLETGGQPATNETGEVVCVFNGEIYGFGRVRRDLSAAGHVVNGTGDTAVIPHLYEEHGLAFPHHLDGMFAIALWDATRCRLVLVRDRVGKKPLLWTPLRNGGLAFASELKALLRLPELDRELDLSALDAYLALKYVPGPRTALRDVHKLAPGHMLVWENGAASIERWWRLDPEPEDLDEAEWLDRVRSTIRSAVQRRLVADVPLGVLLSGGIDSSIVVAHMAEAASEPVRTFTVGFTDQRYDERRFAHAVASRFSTRHEELVVNLTVDELPRLAESFDEPLADEATLPLYLICKLARHHVTVALCGDGGDEAFAGYERYVALGLANRLAVVPGAASLGARLLHAVQGASGEPRTSFARATRLLEAASRPAELRYGAFLELFPPQLRTGLWSGDVLDAIGPPREPVALLGQGLGYGVAGLQRLDVETYLPSDLLLKADLASMAHSLELRSPFLDHEVLQLGLSLPDSLRTRGRVGKVALRSAYSSLLPQETLTGRKLGFGVPLARWFREDLRDFAHDVLLGPTATGRSLFRPGAVEKLLADHVAGRHDHSRRLWGLLMLELWQVSHLDGNDRASASRRAGPVASADAACPHAPASGS
jgi:asparagine synthase (glutamine-hydrolysing)